MPELDGSNYKRAAFSRFVRSGSSIYFADDVDQLHIDLANTYLKNKVVDDAGFIRPDKDNMLMATHGSRGLGIDEDNEGRIATDKILSNLPPIK